MKAGVAVLVFVLLLGMLFVAPVAQARPSSDGCPIPISPSATGVTPQCGTPQCYPVYVTVTGHIYESKAEIDLGGVYLSSGSSSQYAAGCSEDYALSVVDLTDTHYSFFQWVADHGSISNSEASSTYYTPDKNYATATISLLLSIDAVNASGSSDWNYYNSYLGTGWYAGGYQADNLMRDNSGDYFAQGEFTLPTTSNVHWESTPCEDPTTPTCYDEVMFGVALGYPPFDWSFGGIDMQYNLITQKVSLNVIWHTPTDESHQPLIQPGGLGNTISVSVYYSPSTGYDQIDVCDSNLSVCQNSPPMTGVPDLSRAFYVASMNIYAPYDVIDAPPAMWIGIPYITQSVPFWGIEPNVYSPADRVVCDFNQWGYPVETITPGYTSTSLGTSSFSLSFSYG